MTILVGQKAPLFQTQAVMPNGDINGDFSLETLIKDKYAVLFFYPMDFEIPYPPMETKPAPVPRELEVKDKGDFLSNVPHELDEKGYYFFQQDTSKSTGLLIRTTHDAYPKVKDWDEMVDMVTYISTRREHESLLIAEDKKRALDQYWLNLTRLVFLTTRNRRLETDDQAPSDTF